MFSFLQKLMPGSKSPENPETATASQQGGRSRKRRRGRKCKGGVNLQAEAAASEMGGGRRRRGRKSRKSRRGTRKHTRRHRR